MSLFVRWLGAFRTHSGNLNDSFVYEMGRRDEVAAEIIDDNGSSEIHHARIGLLINKAAVIKSFNGDCWSEYDSNGRLHKTRNPRRAQSRHREAWTAPEYTGIVVKGKDLPKRITRTIIWASKEYGLPIYRLTKRGELREVTL